MESGIRQGCPLSPIIFAVCADLLLRQLRLRMQSASNPPRACYHHRAFADDVGVVLGDARWQLPKLVEVLKMFEAVSRLQINVQKTVGIPLWPAEDGEASELIGSTVPEWSQLPVATSAVYLGCLIGPGKKGREWSRAMTKYWDRILAWQWNSLGLHFAAVVYNTYVASTLAFIGQFANPDAELLRLEAAGLRRAAPGPGSWATPMDLWHLKECYGLAQSFTSIAEVSEAAKLRVTCCDNAQAGGLGVSHWHDTLETCGRLLIFPARQLWWSEWRDIAVPEIL